ncbi:MAG: GAF domain-containing protein [Myxococcales bacterium]|nr:GAF domain-containing protein [Myxococcales bacterium]
MSISDLRRALIASTIGGACLALVASPQDPSMTSLSVHPVWAIALILAARYGARGLLSLPALTGSLLVAEWVTGGTGAAALARISRGGDLAIWVVAVGVAVVGTAHERRKAILAQRLDAAELRATRAEAAADQLGEAALALRDRCDRSETSLVFLADVAARMDDPDPTGAGQAALELAMARTGAGAGFVQILDGSGRLRTLTARGRWSAETFWPPALFRDLTAHTALTRARAVAAHEVPGVRADDSDLVAPLIASNGRRIGVLALRRVPFPKLTSAVREDLTAIARWAAGSLARTVVVDSGPAPGTAKRGVETKHVAT